MSTRDKKSEGREVTINILKGRDGVGQHTLSGHMSSGLYPSIDKEYMRELMYKTPDSVYFSTPRRSGKSYLNEAMKMMRMAYAYGASPETLQKQLSEKGVSMTIEDFYREYLCGDFKGTVAAERNPCGEVQLSPKAPSPFIEGRSFKSYLDDPRYIFAKSRETALEVKREYEAVKIHQSNQEKGNTSMNNININTLVDLSKVNSAADEYAKYDELPEGLKKALKKKMELQNEQKTEAAAEAVMTVLNGTEEAIRNCVERIRKLRRDIDSLKAEIGVIERARDYGMATQNFLPSLETLGYHVPMGAGVSAIPADFKAKK